jgi:transposase
LGIRLPENIGQKHWSKNFITTLRQLQIEENENKQTLNELLDSLMNIRKQINNIIKSLRRTVYSNQHSKEIMEILMSFPGVGFITAITLYSEIIDIGRFKRFDELVSYVGLAPAVYSSGEKEKTLGLSKQRNKYLRNLIIESAWIALTKDNALQSYYGKLRNRMSSQKAIIKVSKKLLNRIRRLWSKGEKYVLSTV